MNPLEDGRILEIDLSAGKYAFSRLPAKTRRLCLGGRGFNASYLYREIPSGIDPLGPENILMLSCGLLTGTAAPASSRVHINALSPLTGLLGSSNIGGGAGAAMRSCGIDSIVIRGKAPRPMYLSIENDSVHFFDAAALWGLDTWEAEEQIRKLHPEARRHILAIGPAGENSARFACIVSDRDHAAGRTGMGAVMGAKNLKALVVREQKNGAPNRTKKAAVIIKRYLEQIKSAAEFPTFSTYGGAGYLKWADSQGVLASRNYRENRFPGIDRIDGRKLRPKATRSRGCRGCPVRCKAELRLSDGAHKSESAARPEFESMASLGVRCGLDNLEALVRLDNLCTRLGLDSISAGGAIAFAMDLFERGILTEADTGGLVLVWGNAEAMAALIRQMAANAGLGGMLSQGVRRAAQKIGRGAERYAPHVKGLELSAYHPAALNGTALGYAVANRGGDFNDIYANLEYVWQPEEAAREFNTPSAVERRSVYGKALLVKRARVVSMIMDCLGLCKAPALSLLGAFDLKREASLVADLTGWTVDARELFAAGERSVTLERLFNLKHGAAGRDDHLPEMFFTDEYSPGAAPRSASEWMEPMKQDFYKAMGWNEQGVPHPETHGSAVQGSAFSVPRSAFRVQRSAFSVKNR